MSVDKLVDSTQLDADLTSVANAIRTKGGTSAQLAFPAGFVSAVEAIPTGGGGYTIDEVVDRSAFPSVINISSATKMLPWALGYPNSAHDKHITTVNAPNVTSIDERAFSNLESLATVYLPNVETMVSNIFYNTWNLHQIVLPKVKTVAQYFGYRTGGFDISNPCVIDLGAVTKIESNAFREIIVLKTLIIRSSAVPTLSAVTAFAGDCPFNNGKSGGTLYVPSALISSYQSASNWSTILGYANNQIKSIESTHTDPNAPIDLTLYYADGTPIT